MKQKKYKKFVPSWAAFICIFSIFLLYQIKKTDSSRHFQNSTEADSFTELHVLPLLIPGQVEGTFQHNLIRNLPKTTLHKATILPSLKDCYFSSLVLKTAQSSNAGNYFYRIFKTSIFGNAP